MQKQGSLFSRLIKRVYGIDDVLDEYKLQQINAIGNKAFLCLFGYTLVANCGAAISVVYWPTATVLATWIWVNLGMTLVLVTVIGARVRRLKLDDFEVAVAQLPARIRHLRWWALLVGIKFGGWMLLLQVVINSQFDGVALLTSLTSSIIYLKALAGGAFSGIVMYIDRRLKIKVI